MSDPTPSAKPNLFARKKLTPFLAHEMIYDYANGTLDADRKSALEEFIANDQESQTLLRNIEAAQTYTTLLTGLQVDPEMLSHLIEAESAASLGKRYSSWREWPETLRWSITAIVMSAVVAMLVSVIPWSKILNRNKAGGPENVEVAQIPQPNLEDAETVAANDDSSGDEAPDEQSNESSGDDEAYASGSHSSGGGGGVGGVGGSSAKVAGLAAAVVAYPTATPLPPEHVNVPPELLGRTTPVPYLSVDLPKPSAMPSATPSAIPVTTPAATPAPSTNASSTLAMTETADKQDSRDPKARGFVYRAFMTLNDLEEIGPKLNDEIVSLGGEKAGEVDLGWKRGTGRYYHFELPEANERKMLERLQVYGPVRISKDPHPRVMPRGQVRFILWVESASN